jgi:F-type H+-transporting ATPase subunit a
MMTTEPTTFAPLLTMLADAGGGADPLHHVVDQPYLVVPVRLFSKHVMMQIIAAGLLVLLIPGAFGAPGLVPRGLKNFFEAICLWLRDTIARPILGQHTDLFIPYLWTLFFFVAACNLLGLLPFMATATGNIWVTGTLAVISMVTVVVSGLWLQGKHYIAHFNPGPPWLAPLLVPLEVMGIFTRGFALAVRLFANMIAGHILLSVLIGLIAMAAAAVGTAGGLGVALIVVPASIALSILELFVAVLQAFIITFLTTLFIGQAVNIAHHDEHHDDHGHEHGHGHDAAHGAGHGHAPAVPATPSVTKH